jgi:molybdate transport system regulatory protein
VLPVVIYTKRTNRRGGHEGVICKGVVALLEGIRDLGSLSLAAKQMGMAYSKAWYLMRAAETSVGFLLIDRDGARGSSLTAEGEKLLCIYRQLEQECTELLERGFKELVVQ